MQFLKCLLLIALVSLAQPALARTLRVLSYNIHHSEGRDGNFDLARIAGVINAATPDVVALQELDQGNGRSGFSVFQLDQLAALTGMQGYFGKTINYSGGEYGNGVLVSPSLVATRFINHALPSPAGGEARRAMEVRLSLGAVEEPSSFSFFATHFDAMSDDANRLAQAAFVNGLVANSTTPSLLAGDLNARPSSPVFERILEEWTDTTNIVSPGISRSSQIDYILNRQPEQWRVVTQGQFIVNATTFVASDHYPLLAVVELLPANADFDGDSDVDGADFLTWQRGVGSGNAPAQGDANDDNVVNGVDLTIWKSTFGVAIPRAVAVPEPSCGYFLTGAIVVAMVSTLRQLPFACHSGTVKRSTEMG